MIFPLWKLRRARAKAEAKEKIVRDQMEEKGVAGILTTFGQLPGWADYEKAREDLNKIREEVERPFNSYK